MRRSALVVLTAALVAGTFAAPAPATARGGGRAIRGRVFDRYPARDRARSRRPTAAGRVFLERGYLPRDVDAFDAAKAAAERSAAALRPILRRVPSLRAPHLEPEGPAPRTPARSADATTRGATRPSAAAASAVAPSPTSWQGVTDTSVTPSDSTGAIGPTRYVEMVNVKMAIYSRDGGLLSSIPLGTLTGDPDLTDPQVIWDPGTDRFYFVVMNDDVALTGSSDGTDFEVGFSTTDSPSTGSDWCTYAVSAGYDAPGTSRLLADQPHLGDSQNFLFWGVNVFDFAPTTPSYVGSDAVWMSKPPAGTSCPDPDTLTVGGQTDLRNADSTSVWTPVGVNQTDTAPTGWLIGDEMSDDGAGDALTLFAVTDVGDGTASIAPTGTAVSVPSYSLPANARQAGTTRLLDTGDVRLTQAVSAVDPSKGGALAIWTQHTVFGGGGARVRWYEVDPASPSLYRSGVVSNDNLFVFNAAISPDRLVNDAVSAFGDAMAIGFTTSSVYTDSTVWVASKVGGAALSPWVMVTQSPGPNVDFSCTPLCRWGDYMGATPDPAADETASRGAVWMTSMWNVDSANNTNVDWRTVNWRTSFASSSSGCTMVGTPAGDFLVGSSGPDHLCGGRGDDLLLGRGGDDVLDGGPGNDLLLPEGGNDVVRGGTGYDYLDYETTSSGVSIDLAHGLVTGQGKDRLSAIEGAAGSFGKDRIIGSRIANGLYGLGGADAVYGMRGNDYLNGGPGNDYLNGGRGRDACDAGGGADTKVSCEA